ncbi:T9SS type A sorting domain-containing protein [Winogradskyella ouciana]|uniref:T9SS type A sorting domain-containing protein n=1 Tax=Winogradskyella ouciana TaxID=2608631 RepID=UPI003D2A5990
MKKNYILKKTILQNCLFCCLLLLLSYSVKAQNLNFTIDTAVDNGTSITETISVGPDTYVLTVFHSGNEELDNLGGGDLVFYHSAIDPLNPHMLSVTKNGNPVNFNLNSIDYDTLGEGTISLTNQDGDFISDPTLYPLGAGTLTITNPANGLGISQININPTDSDDLNDFGFHNVNLDIVNSCSPPAGTVVFFSQNCTSGEFFVEVDITDLGSGSPSLLDGTTTYPITSTGTFSLGPYPIGTPVNFTLVHGSDDSCDVDLGSVSDTCPPPCQSPVGTAVIGAQDCNAGTFEIDVTITDLGNGSPSYFDGEDNFPISSTGTFSVGPYPVGTPVNPVLLHGSDASCDVSLPTIADTCSEVLFTIDTAVDDGTNITETIVVGSDTYVLTVAHPGNEELDNLGGGDLVFFHSATDPFDPYVLTITKNGYPTNFTLKVMDYDTLEAVDILLQNQDNEDITPYTNYPLGAGTMVISNIANATNISSFKIFGQGGDDLNDIGFHNIGVDIVDTCASPVGSAIFASQDCTADEFFVDIEVTDLGNGSPSIFDGTTTTPVAATGTINLGPYPTGTPVNFTLQHGSDASCDVDLGGISDTCPPPPVNDECTGAISVACGDTVTGSTVDATDSGSNTSNDVFYSFTDTVDQFVTLSLCNSDYDSYIRVFDDCPQTNEIAGNDDSCGTQSEVTFLATANTTYYLMIEGFGANNGNYEMSVTCAPAAVNDECTSAIAVSCGDTVTGSTVNATDSGNNTSNDVFYSFTDTVLQDVTLSLCNSDYDTFVRVFDDCPQTNQIAGNDDSDNCPGNQSEVTFTAQPNTTYYIMIEGFSGNNGNYDMSVTCIPNVPAPGNDLCVNATPLSLGVTLNGETTAGATDDTTGTADDTTCDPFTFKSDVWYTFTAPASGEVLVNTEITGDSDQANVAVYSTLDCSQLDADIVACSAGNGGELVTVTGLVDGATYYIRVWSDGVAPPSSPTTRIEGTFNIMVTDATLSTPTFDDIPFSYYPNPVKNMLTLNSQQVISKVRVFNMLGQMVLTETPNAATRNLDMSRLDSGAYFVEVSVANTIKTVRVIKQ